MQVPNLLRRFLKSVAGSFPSTKIPRPIIWIPPTQALKPDRNIACAAIIKDEAKYLDEWVSFHLMAGIEHLYLYDNGSTDQTPAVLARYLEDGRVTLINWPHFAGGLNTQCLAYAHAISALRGKYKWLAFIDVDEFLYPVQEAALVDVLRDYEDVPALGVYWVNFGPSGHTSYQPTGVLRNFRRRQTLGTGPEGTTITNYKSIVQPTMISGVISAHAFHSSLHPILALDEARQPIRLEKYRRVRCDRIRINHYFTKSISEWNEKVERASCRAPGHHIENRRIMFYESLGPMDYEDDTILEVQSRLEARAQGA